jgi:polar amino acid transport system permease protein
LNYTFQFGVVLDRFPELLAGAALTIRLSGLAMLFGLMLGTICAVSKVYGPRPLRWVVNLYVEFIRNTPF